MRRWRAGAALAVALAAVLSLVRWTTPAHAAVFRWANDYDVRSLDPYAGQEIFLRSFDANIYEPLVRRGRDLALEPALAASWSNPSPVLWRFTLRDHVSFQDGSPFTADDVVFSFERARAPSSKTAGVLASVKAVRKLDDRNVEIETSGPDPLLLDELSEWPIMSALWCVAHDAAVPAELARGEDSYAADHADGTGPFMVAERVRDERTVLVPNPLWWDKREHDLDRVVFTPITDPTALTAGLESGALDMIYDVPPQDIERIARNPALTLVQGPGLTTIFLGFDQWRSQLLESDVKGRNPYKDRRVRQAFALAIDENAIVTKVMHGHATPAGLLVGPGVAGFDRGLDARPAFDPARARALLAEAGYPKGFATGMDCPNDRYVNDQAICEEIVAMLSRVGIRVNLLAQSRARFFAKILPPPPHSQTSFFLMGWTPSSYDAATVLTSLAATQDPDGRQGDYNVGGYSNPALDALLARIRVERDARARIALLQKALVLVKDDAAYIPLHRQDVVWAARHGVELVQRSDNTLPLRYVRMK